MQTVYCISGLGADERIFKYLDLSFANPIFIKWIKPKQYETLQAYALRIKQEFIHDPEPVIIGLSLGGMIAVEIAKAIPSAKVIIVSSAKTGKEIPYYWKAFRFMPVYRILPKWSVKKNSLIRNYFLSAATIPSKDYIKYVAGNADINFYRWAIGAIVNWQNQTIPSNIIHIHGTNDKLLPYKFVKADMIVNNGGHLMIIDNAAEISKKLKQILLT